MQEIVGSEPLHRVYLPHLKAVGPQNLKIPVRCFPNGKIAILRGGPLETLFLKTDFRTTLTLTIGLEPTLEGLRGYARGQRMNRFPPWYLCYFEAGSGPRVGWRGAKYLPKQGLDAFVYFLKRIVEYDEGIPVDHQRIIFRAEQLDEWKRLCDCDVRAGSTLLLLLRLN